MRAGRSIHTMDNPYRWLKKRWYRRQARRAIWFLRYLDRMLHNMGWGRPQVRRFWEDFIKHPMARRVTLNQLAVVNKITIREERRMKVEQELERYMAISQKLQQDLNAANAKLAQFKPADEVPTVTGPEVAHEVPTV